MLRSAALDALFRLGSSQAFSRCWWTTRNDANPPEQEAIDALARFLAVPVSWLQLGVDVGPIIERNPDGSLPTTATGEADLPRPARVWLQRFLLEITEAGRDGAGSGECTATLVRPGGLYALQRRLPIQFTEAQVNEGMEAIAVFVSRRAQETWRDIK